MCLQLGDILGLIMLVTASGAHHCAWTSRVYSDFGSTQMPLGVESISNIGSNIDPYMDFFPKLKSTLIDICAKIKDVWNFFIYHLMLKWNNLIGYNPQKPAIGTKQAENLIEQAINHYRIAGVSDRSLIDLAKKMAEESPSGTNLGVVVSRAYERLVPASVNATLFERTILLGIAMRTQNIFLLAAASMMFRGLGDRTALISSTRISSDLALLTGFEYLAARVWSCFNAPYPVELSFICKTAMLATIVLGQSTEKSLFQHFEHWLLTQIKASKTDCDELKYETMPLSATNQQKDALFRVQGGVGTAWDVVCAAKGLYSRNIFIQETRKLEAFRTAVNIHNFMGSFVWAGAVYTISSVYAPDNWIKGFFLTLGAGAFRWAVPQSAKIQNEIVERSLGFVRRRGLGPVLERGVTVLEPALSQGFLASNAALVGKKCFDELLSSSVSGVLSPVFNSVVVLWPTPKEQARLRDANYLDVATSIGYNLPGRVMTFFLTTQLFGGGTFGVLSASIATNITAKTFLEAAAERDAQQPMVCKIHAGLGTLASGVFMLKDIGASFGAEMPLSTVSSAMPYLAGIVPSPAQVELFATARRARAVGECAISFLVNASLVFGVQAGIDFAVGPVDGSATNLLLMAAVTTLKPYVNEIARVGVDRLSELSTYLRNRAVAAIRV